MAKIDLTINTPKSKRDLTKDNMLSFMKDKSKEEKEWFVKLMNDNKLKKIDHLHDGKKIDGYELTKVREEFAKKYFPAISKANKIKEKKSTKKPSFNDELINLLK